MTQVNVHIYILECADGSYYVGKYQGDALEYRIAEHNEAKYPRAYTAKRRPVWLVWSKCFWRYDDAVAFERQLKGWSRVKKQALINDDETALKAFSQRGFRPSRILRDAPSGASQDEAVVRGETVLETKQNLHPEERSVTKDGLHVRKQL